MNPRQITLRINGRTCRVPAGISVAAAMALHAMPFRRALDGSRRAPLCGMGVCFECRACVDGAHHVRTCMLEVREGMEVDSDA